MIVVAVGVFVTRKSQCVMNVLWGITVVLCVGGCQQYYNAPLKCTLTCGLMLKWFNYTLQNNEIDEYATIILYIVHNNVI